MHHDPSETVLKLPLGYDHQGICHDSHAIAYGGSEDCGPNTLPTGEGLEKVLAMIEEHEAFEDGPWHNIDFRVLDERFPNSKFIWLERICKPHKERICC